MIQRLARASVRIAVDAVRNVNIAWAIAALPRVGGARRDATLRAAGARAAGVTERGPARAARALAARLPLRRRGRSGPRRRRRRGAGVPRRARQRHPAHAFAAALVWWRFYTFYIYIALGAIIAGGVALRAVRKTDEMEEELERA